MKTKSIKEWFHRFRNTTLGNILNSMICSPWCSYKKDNVTWCCAQNHIAASKQWQGRNGNGWWIWLSFAKRQTSYHYSVREPLRWRQNGRDIVSNHQPHDCLPNRLFRRRSKKISRLRVTGLCVENSAGTGEFPAQMASNAENVSIWWRHHV